MYMYRAAFSTSRACEQWDNLASFPVSRAQEPGNEARNNFPVCTCYCTNIRHFTPNLVKHVYLHKLNGQYNKPQHVCNFLYLKLVCMSDKTHSEKDRQLVVGGSMCKIDVQHHCVRCSKQREK